MVSPISGFTAWAVIGYVAMVAVGRVLFTRDTILDRLINCLPLWSLAGLLLFRCTPRPRIGSVPIELALGCIVMIGMYLYAVARAWESETDPETVWRRQWIYCSVGVVSTAVILLAAPLAVGDSVDGDFNWAGIVVWIAFEAPQAVTALVLARVCVREYRSGNLGTVAKVLCWLMVLACLPFWADQVLWIGQMIGGWQPFASHIDRVQVLLVNTAVVASTLFVIPVVGQLLARADLDRDGRICRKLQPLWRDVCAAVPEIVLSPVVGGRARHDSTARLLRMTVEIRDALLHLGPYLPADTGSARARRDESDGEIRDYAYRLAAAVCARRAGRLPTNVRAVPKPFLTARDFDTELRQLLALARVWPAARAGVVTGGR
ncbi:MAB_1171c family putative transporter [Nocardia sp. NPDC060256]|uniref:MAB_1171c family putative transporter n=1 Tax=unclassified Nocardia TaxID=2637762 RepID=UPI00364BEC16